MDDQKKALRAGDRAALVNAASGTCYNPSCSEPLIVWRVGQPIINYQVAHIRDELRPPDPNADVGWRYWPADDLTQDQRNRFGNLLLLCVTCHKLIDRVDPRAYSVDILHCWKEGAERDTQAGQLDRLFGVVESARLADLIVAALNAPRGIELISPEVAAGDDLLSFAARQTIHVGRQEELSDLRLFLNDPAPFYWWIVTGEAGAGKSRLALELCAESRDHWNAGFITESGQETLIGFEPDEPTLVVVDYAAARANWLGRALYYHAVQAATYCSPLRVLILERSVSESWCQDAFRIARHNESQVLLSRQYANPLQIDGLPDDDLRSLINNVAVLGGQVLSVTEIEYVLDRIVEVDPHRRPLFAIVSTLDFLGAEHHRQSRDSLLRMILERRSAQRSERLTDPLLRERAEELELVATALGGIEPERYPNLLATSKYGTSLQLPSLAELRVHRLGASLLGIQPDILGEIAALDTLGKEEGIARQIAVDAFHLSWRFDPRRYSAFAERVARDHPWHPTLADLLDVHPQGEAERDAWFALAPRLIPYMRSSANPSVDRISDLLDKLMEDDEERSQHAQALMLFHFGNLLLQDRHVERAIGVYTSVLDSAKPSWSARSGCFTNRGVAYLQLGKAYQAEADFTAVIEATSASEESQACCLNNRADLRSAAGDIPGSIDDRSAVLQLMNTSYNRRYIALARRAKSLWTIGNREAAFADLEAILDAPDIVIEQKLATRLTRAEWRMSCGDVVLAIVDLHRVVDGRRNFPGIVDRARSALLQIEIPGETEP